MNRVSILATVVWVCYVVRLGYDEWFRPDLGPDTMSTPLAVLPMDLLGPGWNGLEAPLPKRVVKIAGISDYLSRVYSKHGAQIHLYVGFVRGGASGGLHHPEVCFKAHGLSLKNREIITIDGADIPKLPLFVEPKLLFNEFRWTRSSAVQAYSLSTFVYNRRLDPDVDRLRLADRYPGVPYFVSLILVGDYVGPPKNTRRVYKEALSYLLPKLLAHFPQRDR